MSCELKNILWSGKNLREGKEAKGMQTKFDIGDKVLVEGVVKSMNADSDGLVYSVVASGYRLECTEDKLVGRVIEKFDNEEVLLIPKKAVISTDFEPGGTEYRIVVDAKYMVNSVTFNQFIQMIKENGEEK